MLRSVSYIVVAFLSSVLPTQAAVDPDESVRQAFLAAYRSAIAGETATPDADSDALRGYPLYPYLQAERLRQSLATAGPDSGKIAADRDIEAFLGRHGDEPVAQSLRRSWLASLAERRRWRVYLAHYRDDLADQTLRCNQLRARIALDQDDGLAGLAIAEWLTPGSAAETCDPVFDWLRNRQLLTDELLERRARLALGAGEARLARWLAKSLPAERADPIERWAALIEQPQKAIDGLIARSAERVDEQALLAGWTRLARRNPDAARQRYRSLVRSRGFDAAQASTFARELALGMSWSRRPGSLEYFSRVLPGDMDELTFEWYARAALWSDDWRRAAQVIAAMPAHLREQARWRYWDARAAEQLGDSALAQEHYTAAIPTDNYYAALAAARLDRPFEPRLERLHFDRSSVEALAAIPAFVRARELVLAGLEPLAEIEWLHGDRSLTAKERHDLVGLAVEWRWFYQAIATAARQELYNDYQLLYPRPFNREVRAATRLTGLPGELIYGVLRQESLYRVDAVSSAGALGLLQLLPSTARHTARRWQRPAPAYADLLDPAINIPLGAATLRGHLDRFDGRTTVALAAYNAGPRAARRWLPPTEMEADIWVENIPYNETRSYVQRVLWHSLVFAWLRDDAPQNAAAWLKPITPDLEIPTRVADVAR